MGCREQIGVGRDVKRAFLPCDKATETLKREPRHHLFEIDNLKTTRVVGVGPIEHEKVRKARGLSFKQAVNEALRAGLSQLTAPGPRAKNFRTGTVNLGRCLIGSLDNVSETLATAEREAFQ